MKKLFTAGLAAMMIFNTASALAYVSPKYELTEWTITETGGSAQIDTSQKKSGAASLKVFAESGAGTQNIKIFQKVTGLEPSTNYELTFYSKAENATDFKLVRDIFYSSDARPEASAAYDWGKTTIEFKTGASANSVQLQFVAKGNGSEDISLWIDECSLTKKGDSKNLIKNGGFDERVDVTAPATVSNLAANAGDREAFVTWKDSPSDDCIGVFIYVNDNREPIFVEKGIEAYSMSDLENDTEYSIKIAAIDDWYNESEFVVVNVTPEAQREAPEVKADDEKNVILNIDDTMEYRIDGGVWTAYSETIKPNLEGCHIVEVRYAKTQEHIAGKIATLLFYRNKQASELSVTMQIFKNQITLNGNSNSEKISIVAEGAGSAAYENIVFIKEAETQNNSFNAEFLMPENAQRDKYQINVGIPESSERIKQEFYYVPEAVITGFMGAIQNANNAGIKELLMSSDNMDIMECLGVNTSQLYEIDNSSYLAAKLFDIKNELDEKLLAEYVMDYIAFDKLSKCNSGAEVIETIDEFNNILKLSFENTDWDKIDDNSLKAWIGNYFKAKTITSLEEMAEEYKIANILFLLNTKSYVEIEDVITKYAKELGIIDTASYTRYLALSTYNRENKNKSIKLECDYSSIDDFKTKFSTIMIDTSSSSGASGGSGGGSGSGSSSSTGGNNITYSEQSAAIPNNLTPNEVFTDLSGAEWAKEEIVKLYEYGVVSGMGDGRFEPNSPVTREQFVKMVVDAFGITVSGELEEFKDVPEDKWSYPYITAMYSNGLISGYEDGTFQSSANITREDIAVIICRVCDSMGIELSKNSDVIEFSDADEISYYAKQSILRLNAAGIMNGMGDNTIAPKADATRAMAAKIIYMVMEGK